ncbi:MAG: cytochrome c, NapC/NirT family [Dehalococcoidia bacterium]|nr:cytochrome c, NapC/NirT family [Dehalococcoidia bacterium]
MFKARALLGLPGLGIALVVAVALIAGGRELQQRPGFCANCHNSSFQEWKESGAANKHPVCIECHSGTGVVGFVAAKYRGGVMIASFIAGADPQAAKAQVPNENCVKCHIIREKVTTAHHRTIPSQARLDYCSLCHGENSEGQESSLSGERKLCSSCHNHGEGGSFIHRTEIPLSRQGDLK